MNRPIPLRRRGLPGSTGSRRPVDTRVPGTRVDCGVTASETAPVPRSRKSPNAPSDVISNHASFTAKETTSMVWRVRDAQFGRLTGRIALGATAICAMVLAASCSALSGSNPSPATVNPNAGLEKTTLKVGAIAGSSSAALYIAEDKGFFNQAGLNVQIVTTSNGGQALSQLEGGALDVTLANDVSGIQAHIKGQPLKLVFDGPSCAPNTFVISALSGSGITKLADIKNKKIGVSSLKDG
ncbi:MAG TPA: ABC transporter substrate-binding protein, partial [Pseudonocardiaceae bacterium]|nr:ABC transporter substrate-binding protein [Pseudonocardiaceae bacterium]